jgi:hypothetical protein
VVPPFTGTAENVTAVPEHIVSAAIDLDIVTAGITEGEIDTVALPVIVRVQVVEAFVAITV